VVPRTVGKAPFTLAFVVVLWVVALASGSLLHGPDEGLLKNVGAGTASLTSGRVWTLATYGLWCSGLSAYIATTVLAVLLLAPAERRLGVWRTAGLLALCQIAGALLGIALVELGALAGDLWLGLSVPDLGVGASVGIVGVGLALSADLSALWRRRLRLVLTVATLLFTLYAGEALDILRLGGAATGLLAGVFLVRRRYSGGRLLPASHAETRVLVAVFALTSALGPAITWLSLFLNLVCHVR
jgi:hypothetical protein